LARYGAAEAVGPVASLDYLSVTDDDVREWSEKIDL
jgi:hypothetical protein